MDEVRLIEVKEGVFSENEKIADQVRSDLAGKGVLLLNLMSSPGAGKTTLILETIKAIGENLKLGVLEADIDAVVDAEKVAAAGIPAVQLRTGGFCHLDATMVTQGLAALPLENLDAVIIENVGNLVCPASYDVGSHLNIVLVSIPEGGDKVEKYPVMFAKADLILITKTDLLPYFDYDIEHEKIEARKIKPNVDILEINSKDDESIQKVIEWIEFKRKMRS